MRLDRSSNNPPERTPEEKRSFIKLYRAIRAGNIPQDLSNIDIAQERGDITELEANLLRLAAKLRKPPDASSE